SLLPLSLSISASTTAVSSLSLHDALPILAVSAIVLAEMFYLLNSRFVTGSVLGLQGLFGNRMVWLAIGACLVLQLGFVHLAPLQAVFGSTALGAGEWGRVALAGLAIFAIAELEKAVVRRIRGTGGAPQTA